MVLSHSRKVTFKTLYTKDNISGMTVSDQCLWAFKIMAL